VIDADGAPETKAETNARHAVVAWHAFVAAAAAMVGAADGALHRLMRKRPSRQPIQPFPVIFRSVPDGQRQAW
jgi:hypothetical protein